MTLIDPELLEILVCPVDKEGLIEDEDFAIGEEPFGEDDFLLISA